MPRQDRPRPRHLGVAGLTLLGVLLLIAILAVSSWRSGLLTVRPGDLSRQTPRVPALPRPAPDPTPIPLPKPGPRVVKG